MSQGWDGWGEKCADGCCAFPLVVLTKKGKMEIVRVVQNHFKW